jgi:serine/threonine protein kinase
VSLELLIDKLRDRKVDERTLSKLKEVLVPKRADLVPRWREILQDLPFDEWSFDDRFGNNAWQRTIAHLQGVCDMLPVGKPGRSDTDTSVLSFLGVLLFTLNGLAESSHRRYPRTIASIAGGPARTGTPTPPGALPSGDGPPPAVTHDCARSCARLIQDDHIVDAVGRIYFPDRLADLKGREHGDERGDPGALKVWREDVCGNHLTFHRHGTTSIILRGLGSKKDGERRPFALKLILFPFLRVSRIEQSTLAYKKLMPEASENDPYFVRVWSSASSWIVMRLVDGTPLNELYAEHISGTTARVDLDNLRRYGVALFDALCEFDVRFNTGKKGPRLVHGDLSPSNIIVSGTADNPAVHFIDIGRNYLYSHTSVLGQDGADGAYIAPEVKAGTADDSIYDADLFSLGHLLILLGGVGVRRDRTVPDAFYARVPMIARFIEDLIEHDPANRLLLFPAEETGGKTRYQRLHEQFLAELDAAQAAEQSKRSPTDGHWFRALRVQVRHRLPEAMRPLGGMPGRLLRIRKSQRSAKAKVPLSARQLVFWSWLSATAWAITVSLTLTWFIRQLSYKGEPWQWGTRSVEVYQKGLDPHHDSLLPIIDDLRWSYYRFPDLAHNWPSLLVGLTYALVGAKYYQNLFSGSIPTRAGWRYGQLTAWAVAAEFFMRLETIVASVLVIPTILVEPRLWSVDAAIGQILVYFCNLSAFSFSMLALRRARAAKLATVPLEDSSIIGVSAFEEWVPSSLFYAVTVAAMGTLIFFDKLQDKWMYALGVSAINFFLFYIIKCGRGAADVRVLVTRASFAAERLRRMAERRTSQDGVRPAVPRVPDITAGDDRHVRSRAGNGKQAVAG